MRAGVQPKSRSIARQEERRPRPRETAPPFSRFLLCSPPAGDDAMTGDTDKYLAPQDLRELGDDSLPQEGYVGFSVGARSQR